MIILPGPNYGLCEIPKTGTTFIRCALARFQIKHRMASPKTKACPRHSPPHCYDLRGMRIVSQVRDPASWAESFWDFHHELGMYMEKGRYYAQAHLLPVGEECQSFSLWIERLLRDPGCVSTYFRLFIEPAEMLLRNRWLEADLSLLLNMCGHPIEEWQLKKLPHSNVSKPRDLDWCGLRERFVETEDWLERAANAESTVPPE